MATHVAAVTLLFAVLIRTALASDESSHTDSFSHTQWTIHEGLPSNTVRAVAQTPDGFLWVGTRAGLARFDGVDFRIFDPTNTPELARGHILELHVDREETLWIGTLDGGVIAYREAQFIRVFGSDIGAVSEIVETPDGTIWIAGSEGLIRFDGLTPEWILDRGTRVSSLVVDRQGNVWASTTESVFLFDGNERVQQGTPAEHEGGQLVIDPAGRVTLHGRYELTFFTPTPALSVPLAELVPPAELTSIENQGNGWIAEDSTIDQDQFLWIASRSGLFRVSADDLHSDSIRLAPEQRVPVGIRTRINCVFGDRDGTIWAGTESLGLLRLDRRHALPIRSSPVWDDNDVIAVVKSANCPWIGGQIGTSGDHDWVFRRLDGTEEVTLAPAGTKRIESFTISGSRLGGFYLGHDRGVMEYREGDFHVVEVPKQWLPLGEPPFECRDGTIWFCDGNESWTGSGEHEMRVPGRILLETSRGSLWLLDQETLVEHSPSGIKRYTTASGLPRGEIHGAWEDPEGRIWFTTYGSGFVCLVKGRFLICSTANGLPDNNLGGILEDDSGRVWISSAQGLFTVEITSLDIFARGDSETVACRQVTTDESSGRWSARERNGELYFESIHGMFFVDPVPLPAVAETPLARVETVLASPESIPRLDRIELPQGVRNIEIVYTAPTQVDAFLVRFRFRLDGVDSDWVRAGSQRSAFYTRLPPGSHRFAVTATNTVGSWNEQGDSLVIVVPHEFHESLWFRASAALVLFALPTAVFQLRSREQKRHLEDVHQEAEKRKEAEYSLRELDHRLLGAQEDERRRIAETLQNEIKGRLRDLTRSIETEATVTGRNLGELIEVGNTLCSDIDKLSHTLHPARLEQLGLIDGLADLCHEISHRNPVTIDFRPGAGVGGLTLETATSVYRIAQEAIHNSIKYSGANTIHVHLAQQESTLSAAVFDEGRGFDPRGRAGSGLGLTSMRERARAVGGSFEIDSQPGKGARITVVVPIQRDETR